MSNNEINNYDFENDETYRVVAEETKKLNFFERLISIFVSPVQLMRNIAQKPVIGMPFLILLLFSIPGLFFSGRYTQITMEEMGMIMLERYGVDYFGSSEAMAGAAFGGSIGTIVGTLFGMITNAAFAALFLLLFSKIVGGKAKYQQYFSMYLHTGVLLALGTLIWYMGSSMMGSSLNVVSLAAIFTPDGNMTQPAYMLLSNINIFSIWAVVVEIIGVREMNGFSTARAAVPVIIMYALSCALAIASSYGMILMFDALFGMMGGM